MQSADDVQLGDPELQRFPRLVHDFSFAQLETIGIALLPRERTKLAGQVAIVDVAIDDVAGAVAGFPLAREIGDGADGVQVLAFEESQRVGVGDPFTRRDFLVQIAQLAALNEEIHPEYLAEASRGGKPVKAPPTPEPHFTRSG